MNKTFKLSAIAATLVISSMLVGCGSSSKDGKPEDPTTPVDPAPTAKDVNLVVVDGYVGDANVVEVTKKSVKATKGSKLGQYTVSTSVAADKYEFASVGGCVDVNDDQKCTADDLRAPTLFSLKGGMVLSPFTTFIQKGEITEEKIKGVFKLPADVDLTADYTGIIKDNPGVAKVAVVLGRALENSAKISPRTNLLPDTGNIDGDTDTPNTGGDTDTPNTGGGSAVNVPDVDASVYQGIFAIYETASKDKNTTDAVLAAADSNVSKIVAQISADAIKADGLMAIENNATFKEAANSQYSVPTTPSKPEDPAKPSPTTPKDGLLPDMKDIDNS